jgi:hypothetical protein
MAMMLSMAPTSSGVSASSISVVPLAFELPESNHPQSTSEHQGSYPPCEEGHFVSAGHIRPTHVFKADHGELSWRCGSRFHHKLVDWGPYGNTLPVNGGAWESPCA